MDENDLIRTYSLLSIGDKRRELGREITELTVVMQNLISNIVPNYNFKEVDEYTNLFDKSIDEDKYFTGLYQDVIEFKDILATYLEATNIK